MNVKIMTLKMVQTFSMLSWPMSTVNGSLLMDINFRQKKAEYAMNYE